MHIVCCSKLPKYTLLVVCPNFFELVDVSVKLKIFFCVVYCCYAFAFIYLLCFLLIIELFESLNNVQIMWGFLDTFLKYILLWFFFFFNISCFVGPRGDCPAQEWAWDCRLYGEPLQEMERNVREENQTNWQGPHLHWRWDR